MLLDDIQKQIATDHLSSSTSNATELVKTPPFRRIDGEPMADHGDIEEGVVRGFAIQHAIPSGFVLPTNHSNHLSSDFDTDYLHQAVAGNKAGFRPHFIHPFNALGHINYPNLHVHEIQLFWLSLSSIWHKCSDTIPTASASILSVGVCRCVGLCAGCIAH